MNKGKRPIGKILMILSVIFFYLPILYMIIFSFNDGKSLTSFTGFSLRWYKHMLESADMMDALSTTFSMALLATFISTVAGTIAAIGVSKSKKLIRDLMEQANNLPIMNPEIVTAIRSCYYSSHSMWKKDTLPCFWHILHSVYRMLCYR